jgi:cytochrome c-type biogenesis protein CcmE
MGLNDDAANRGFDDRPDDLADDSGLNLAPRPAAERVRARSNRRALPMAMLALFVLAGGFLVVKLLGDAIDYYCNVDEVGTKSGCVEGDRFRVQGEVVSGSLGQDGTATTFTVAFGGVGLPVRLDGEPGGVFKECIAVVVRGELRDGTFYGDNVETKHDDEYDEKNADRVADGEGDQCTETVDAMAS